VVDGDVDVDMKGAWAAFSSSVVAFLWRVFFCRGKSPVLLFSRQMNEGDTHRLPFLDNFAACDGMKMEVLSTPHRTSGYFSIDWARRKRLSGVLFLQGNGDLRYSTKGHSLP
jgi:hypothetical protein